MPYCLISFVIVGEPNRMTDTIRILGVPMDFGQGRRGVDMGPSAIRYAGLQNQLSRLGHTVIE